MNKIFRKLAWRNIVGNFKQFLSVVVIVMLSVMLLSGFVVNSKTLEATIDKYYAKSNLADLWVLTDKITDEDKNFYISEQIESDTRLYFEQVVQVKTKNIENQSKVYVSDGRISKYKLESGKEGCLIDKSVAENRNIKIGFDELVYQFNYKISENQSITLEIRSVITGTMSYVECADTYTYWPVYYTEEYFSLDVNDSLSRAGLPATFSEIPFNQILIKTDDVKETHEKIENHYKSSESKLLSVFDRNGVESVVLLDSELSQSKKMIYVFPVIFFVVSILVILTTIDQLILQEKQKIGTLKSVGIPDKKILKHYSGYGAVLCSIGALLGVIFGSIIIPMIMFVKYHLVYSIPESYVTTIFPFWLMILILAVVILLGYLVSYVACHKILHKRPIECLKFSINNSNKLKKSNGKFKNLPFSLKMAVRNIKIKPIRTVMATIGIAGCMALLLCGFGIGNTLTHSVDNDLGNVFKYDITTTYNKADFEEKLQSEITSLNKYELWTRSYVTATKGKKSSTTTIYELQPNSKISSIKLEGNEVCVSKSIADDLKLKVGDEFYIFDGVKNIKLKLTKIQETSLMNGIYVAKDLGIESVTKLGGAWIDCKGSNFDDELEKINSFNGTSSAMTMSQMRDSAYNKVSSIDLMTGTIKVFAILLAVVVLLNLVFLIMKERNREIATLKVIGKGMIDIGLSVFFEILFMAIIGSAVGMLLGFPLLILVLSINKVKVFNFLYYLSPWSYVFAFVIILATILFISLFSLYRIKKVNMVESLKSVE